MLCSSEYAVGLIVEWHFFTTFLSSLYFYLDKQRHCFLCPISVLGAAKRWIEEICEGLIEVTGKNGIRKVL